MTWTKLGDEFCDTAADLSDAAFRTHVEALGHSNRLLLDLVVPKSHLRRFATTLDYTAAAVELVVAGWWEDCEDVYRIGLRFPEWQQDAEQITARRKSWSAAQLRKRNHGRGDHAMCLPKNCAAARPGEVSSAGSSDDTRDDPVSVSVSGRDRALDEEGLPTEVGDDLPAQSRLGDCSKCGHRSPLDENGRCAGRCCPGCPSDSCRAAVRQPAVKSKAARDAVA